MIEGIDAAAYGVSRRYRLVLISINSTCCSESALDLAGPCWTLLDLTGAAAAASADRYSLMTAFRLSIARIPRIIDVRFLYSQADDHVAEHALDTWAVGKAGSGWSA